MISEPALANMNQPRQREIALYIAQLLDAGFSISLATSDGLRALESDDIDTLMEEFVTLPLEGMLEVDYKNAIKKDKRLTRDSALIINEHDFPRLISMRHLKSLTKNEQAEYIDALMSEHRQISLILDSLEFDDSGNIKHNESLIASLQANLKDVSVYTDYRLASLNSVPAIKSLLLLSNQLSHMEDININIDKHYIGTDELQLMFQSMQQVRKIDITAIIRGDSLQLRPACLPKLQELHIRNKEVSESSVINLIQAAPNLQILRLYRRLPNYEPKPKKLKHLFITDVSAKQFSAYLQASPHIEEMCLFNCHDMLQSFDSTFAVKRFDALKKLNLYFYS